MPNDSLLGNMSLQLHLALQLRLALHDTIADGGALALSGTLALNKSIMRARVHYDIIIYYCGGTSSCAHEECSVSFVYKATFGGKT